MNKIDLIHLVREVIQEAYSNVEEAGGSHSDAKDMIKAVKWIENNLEGIRVEDVKDGQKICPPKERSSECYTIHKGGKGRFDLYRFLSKAYEVSKHEIENAISSNRPLNLLGISLPKIKLGKKIWIIDAENEEIILDRNKKNRMSFYDLDDKVLDDIIELI
tara:strand:- start:4241 stop:4723 length:483 start_codon:yes stop_codon:yes gene_type:complete